MRTNLLGNDFALHFLAEITREIINMDDEFSTASVSIPYLYQL